MKKITSTDALTVLALFGMSALMLICSAVISARLDLSPHSHQQLDSSSLERLTGVVIGLLGALILFWLFLSIVASVLTTLGSRTGHHRMAHALAHLSPPFIMRIAVATLGSSLVIATSANASEPPQHPAAVITSSNISALPNPTRWNLTKEETLPQNTLENQVEGPELLSPGWVPQPISLPLQRVAGGTPRADQTEVIVRAGDSLWSIAAAHLKTGASAAEIAAVWPHWYEANKIIIGPNPDHLALGLVLHAPPALNYTH
ncbi:hypothetical protein CQ018_00925 [Arthrobacter sp. MYb227]|uniref:LysM peptidoglycan-binding domain-containing protein n=1 Tax=Arthrobacter sp. MYb227 TaxID=1848601 RepID=UPI000CFBC134|nr:hypothetical protein [Arthrobacter sp. MYb227]PQZ95893.1 hypothetical protein CQ018_00925 [Arthrobacter sp. MYb227]